MTEREMQGGAGTTGVWGTWRLEGPQRQHGAPGVQGAARHAVDAVNLLQGLGYLAREVPGTVRVVLETSDQQAGVGFFVHDVTDRQGTSLTAGLESAAWEHIYSEVHDTYLADLLWDEAVGEDEFGYAIWSLTAPPTDAGPDSQERGRDEEHGSAEGRPEHRSLQPESGCVQEETLMELNADQHRLLAAYEDGSMIWDAAELAVIVRQLTRLGVIEAVPGSRAHAITLAGRERLAATPGSSLRGAR